MSTMPLARAHAIATTLIDTYVQVSIGRRQYLPGEARQDSARCTEIAGYLPAGDGTARYLIALSAILSDRYR